MELLSKTEVLYHVEDYVIKAVEYDSKDASVGPSNIAHKKGIRTRCFRI